MSTELFDYIQAIKPSLGDEKRAKIGLMVMHYITLARVCDGHVKLDSVLTTSGRSFAHKVMRHASLVRTLAFALKVDMTCMYDDSAVPEGLKRLYACISRNKSKQKLEDARSEMWDLVIFARVSQAVMAALHEDTLRRLDETYCGHRPAGYKPKPKWFGLGGDESTPPVRARDLPRAKSPRATLDPAPRRDDRLKTSSCQDLKTIVDISLDFPGLLPWTFWRLLGIVNLCIGSQLRISSSLLFHFFAPGIHQVNSKYSTFDQFRLEARTKPLPSPSRKVVSYYFFIPILTNDVLLYDLNDQDVIATVQEYTNLNYTSSLHKRKIGLRRGLGSVITIKHHFISLRYKTGRKDQEDGLFGMDMQGWGIYDPC
ncbi:hypothetical protein B0J17DRAFT_704270 [Rhizoctonia solani]|nr:hypothetical protein B0J17DRAFT_704270 [Rhizoctonia solani]